MDQQDIQIDLSQIIGQQTIKIAFLEKQVAMLEQQVATQKLANSDKTKDAKK